MNGSWPHGGHGRLVVKIARENKGPSLECDSKALECDSKVQALEDTTRSPTGFACTLLSPVSPPVATQTTLPNPAGYGTALANLQTFNQLADALPRAPAGFRWYMVLENLNTRALSDPRTGFLLVPAPPNTQFLHLPPLQ